MKYSSLVLPLLLLSVYSQALAAPRIPSSDDEIVETLPARFQGKDEGEFLALRKQALGSPENQTAVVKFLKTSISRGWSENDPRYFGFAEAALEEPLRLRPQDPELLLYRGIIRQRNHDFLGAKADLLASAQLRGRNPQVWATLASVQTLLGEFAEAEISCKKLAGATSTLTVESCLALPRAANGKAQETLQTLLTLLESSQDEVSDSERNWAASIAGELAERLGKDRDAEARYKKLLEADPNDSFTLTAYADLLNRTRRFAEVQTLLAGKESIEGLLLRLTIAEKATLSPAFVHHSKMLKEYFNREESRGEEVHLREKSMYQLFIDSDSGAALITAEKNWKMQKESIDLLLFAEAAVQAGSKTHLESIREWIRESKWEDARVERIIQENVVL